MSPGATFERVYHELKRMLTEGELPPGTPIEPALIGKQIASSITPIRDALHRLTGERLVETPNHNGFRAPMPTEGSLRDLYDWNAHLIALAARKIPKALTATELSLAVFEEDPVAATADLFSEIVRSTGSAEHICAVRQLNDRLAPMRMIEAKVVEDTTQEYEAILQAFRRTDRKALTGEVVRYHGLRKRSVAAIISRIEEDER